MPRGKIVAQNQTAISEIASSYVSINGESDGTLLQYSCLDNPMDRGALQALVAPLSYKESDSAEATEHRHILSEVGHSSRYLQDWRRQWHPIPVLLPGESHGRSSLVGCSPWGREESDTTERLPFHFSLSCIGEGNGNPLQCSCLENPRDGGSWWAAVYGVTQSRTRLK